MENLEVREIFESDLKSICDLYKQSFDEEHFLNTFNHNDLIFYFEQLLNYSNYKFLCVDNNSGKVAGFLMGGYNSELALKEFKKKKICIILMKLIANPKFLFEKAILLFVKRPHLKSNLRLNIIAISSIQKGKGIAKLLIKHFEDQIVSDGEKSYGLSARKSNKKAIEFYLKNNFVKDFEYFHSIYFYKNLL